MTPFRSIRFARLPSGLTLPYLEQGRPTGCPVLFLHGITDSCRSFGPVLAHLPGSVHAIAPSQRGHGNASLPETYRLVDFATDLAAFMDELGLERAIVVGHSMGASVAQRFALDHPERVGGLILAGAFAALRRNPDLVAFGETEVMQLKDPVDPTFVRAFQESTLARPIPEPMLNLFVAESLKVPACVWRAAWAGLMDADLTPELSRISAPTLLVWGNKDTMALWSEQHSIVRAVPDARCETFLGAGHALHWEEPARFATLVADFAAACGSVAASAA
jgi:non-heme chloroperoxidase